MSSLSRSARVSLALCLASVGSAEAQPSPFVATSSTAASTPPVSPPPVAPTPVALPVVTAPVASPVAPAPVATSAAPAPVATSGGITVIDVHRTLGLVALGTFATALTISAASGNLSKLMDPDRCCPDGGQRSDVWRTTDRVLVNVGIASYSGAAVLSIVHLLTTPGERVVHNAHRWLALGHGAAFVTSAVTGLIMARSQPNNPERFATAARIHTASNVLLVPLLTMAFSNILFE